jgi:hypothetical protein
MSIRLMRCSVLIMGAALFGMACGPSADAPQHESPLPQQQAAGAFCDALTGSPCVAGQGGQEKKPACTGHEPGLRYVSRDPVECLAITFNCEEGFTQFFNDCGCGCQREKKACDYDDPKLSYVSRDPVECLTLNFNCEEGSTQFFNDCGCGCRRRKKACRDDAPNRTYISRDPNLCAAIRFTCEPGKVPFFDTCGCGCEPAP